MDCRDVRRAISSHVDGLMDPEESFLINQHLDSCAKCREYLRSFEQDAMALSQYLRRAPYAPVARDISDKIQKSHSPWWSRIRTGGYQVAGAAGVAIVLLIVLAGAWALREMATSDGDPSQQETMIGVEDVDDEENVDEAARPALIGEDDVDLIVDRLDEAGLVFDVDARSEGEGYIVEYGRIAFDRHLTLLEYRITELEEDARLMLGVFADDGGGGGADFSDGWLPDEGWLALPPIDPGHDHVLVQDGETLGDLAQIVYEVPVDLSPIQEYLDDRDSYRASDTTNGIELCCLRVEHGVAVSTISYETDIVDEDELVYVDESLQPVDSPPEIDPAIEPIWPDVLANGERLHVLDIDLAQALPGQGEVLGVLDLPYEGELQIVQEHLVLLSEREDHFLSIYQGPWNLQIQLGETEVEAEPTPEPTVPPDVAEEDATPTPEATPTPDDDDETEERLRLLVYMVRQDEIGTSVREIGHTTEVATAAIRALLEGPDLNDEDVGLGTEIPADTELLGISLEDGTLTVNLSDEFTAGGGSASILMRLAQVVHTGTQFESVDDVQILIEGQRVETIGGEGAMIDRPMNREDFEDQAPAILIERPAPHETVGNEIRLSGTSNTFEANLQIEIIDPMGNQIYRDYATASAGTGTRGEFDLTIPVDFEGEGLGSVRMFEHSARDGSRENVVVIPVRFEEE